MSKVEQRTVSTDEEGMRLDRWFKLHYPSLRHGEMEKLLRKGQIRVDGGRSKANRRLNSGELIRVPPLALSEPKTSPNNAMPSRKQIEEDKAFLEPLIIYQDDTLIAFNKPFGLPVQGGIGAGRNIDRMLHAFGSGEDKPRLVHRLDRDTGGVLLVAKSRKAAAQLGHAFQQHAVEKVYWAITKDTPQPRLGRIDMKIGTKIMAKGTTQHEMMAPSNDQHAKKAFTDYQVVETARDVSFVALRPITGRKHQLRVHCAALDTPIVGDRKYGGPQAVLDGVSDKLHLFCKEMTFEHPVSGKIMTIAAELHGHMLQTWKFFGFSQMAELTPWPQEE